VNAVNVPEIERTLRLLVSEGDTFEIRALGSERGREVTLSGYFTDPVKAATAIAQSCRGMVGIYTTLNPVRPELLARCANRIAPAKKNGTTSDHHVIRRSRLLIDIDGVPVAGISASDEEHEAALNLAAEIEDELAQRGWPRPLRGDSGNGAHLDYAIDLPADDSGLVERVLHAANARWGSTLKTSNGDVTLKIDTSNKNPARITKIFGTPARKGDDIPGRPHRMSKIVAAPERLDVVSREQLEAFASEFGPTQARTDDRKRTTNQSLKTLDVQDWLTKHGIQVRSVNHNWIGKQGNGTCYELEECPQNSDHNRGEAYVLQHSSGAISAGCQHQSCQWDWAWFKEKYQPKSERKTDDISRARARKKQPTELIEIPATFSRQNGQLDLRHAGLGPEGGYRCTDLGNARRFADMHGNRMRYVHAWGQWLTWDGKRWKRDNVGSDVEAAKQVTAQVCMDAARCMMSAAQQVANGDATPVAPTAAEALVKWGTESSKASRINAMLAMAKSERELAAQGSQFDQDLWALNVANGTIDLKSGEIRPHRQADMITRLAATEYDPEAEAPHWERFLLKMIPDEEVRTWLQRFAGYSLTGNVGEQCLAFCYGTGANGKSVFLDVVLKILGDYALRAAPDLVLAKLGEAHPTELADLEGRRFVVCSEIDEGKQWNEGLIKRITGDATITARRMREDFFTFAATHKLWIAANNKPRVRGTDHGIWRRMKLVPWLVTITDEEKDKELATWLVEDEGPGILAWLVRGCLEWQSKGLIEPEAIRKATAEYRMAEDVIGRWIEDRCDLHEHKWMATTGLYENYAKWCEEEGEGQPWKRKNWKKALEQRGFHEGKNPTGTARAIIGMALRERLQW
jgi:P4 family phage/plasmid primase-like protien